MPWRQRNHQPITPDHAGIEIGDFVGVGHEGYIELTFAHHELCVTRSAFGDVKADAGMLAVEAFQQAVEEAACRKRVDADA